MAAEKITFSQRCNLLSQYLKEKRANNSLQVQPTTMDFLTNMEAHPSDQTTPSSTSSWSPKPAAANSIDLFPQFAKNPEAALPDHHHQPGSAPQMTIFYGGHVLVFNDLQSEKAREIMGLATKGSSMVSSGFVSNGGDKMGNSDNTNNHQSNAQDIKKLQPQARRASLHKFLAKRKERVAAIAPYQVNQQRASSPSKSEEQMSSRDEGQSSKQLELKLF